MTVKSQFKENKNYKKLGDKKNNKKKYSDHCVFPIKEISPEISQETNHERQCCAPEVAE